MSEQVLNQILAAISALDTKVSALDTKVTALDTKVTALDTNFSSRLESIEAKVRALLAANANEQVRIINCMKANVAALQPFKFDRDGNDWPERVMQPPTLLDLAVAGNENKPGLDKKPNWNKARGQAFLQAAILGYTDDGSDGEGEVGDKARTVRVKVINAVGGNVTNVFATQYQFH